MLKFIEDLKANSLIHLNGITLLKDIELMKEYKYDVSGEGYCDYLKLQRINDDTYILTPLWINENRETLRNLEDISDNFVFEMEVKFNEEIKNSLDKDGNLLIDYSESELNVDTLYVYISEDMHLYNDNERLQISLDTYKVNRLER